MGTGGYAAEISNGIIKAVGHIAGEVTTQYIIRYIPDTAGQKVSNKDFRKIKVTVPSLPNVKIRYRVGYYPNPVGGPAPAFRRSRRRALSLDHAAGRHLHCDRTPVSVFDPEPRPSRTAR